MGFHHVAIATRDAKRTHDFYTAAMGFRLVKVEPVRSGKGWAKHLFYDTGGGGMIAFWDLHDPALGDDWDPSISRGLGLPEWTNHLAFRAEDLEDLAARRERWLDRGLDVLEIDHGWCTSIYTRDPNGILVEWCTTTRPFTADDERRAHELLDDPAPEPLPDPPIHHHRGRRTGRGGRS